MAFLAPIALLGLLFVPLIVAFYMLRLRRAERVVSSTYLWQQLVRDVEANAPWQRLRRSLLLLLQLLLVVALALLVARPFTERAATLARDLVIVVDATASMAATDVFPDRLTAAKRAAIEALAGLPADARVSVVAAGNSARVVANEVSDRGRASRAIEGIEVASAGGNLSEALTLAGALGARARGAEVLVVTDDAGERSAAAGGGEVTAGERDRLRVPVRVLTVGRDRDNQAIAALAVRVDPSGLKRSAFVSVSNSAPSRVIRRLQILADGSPVTARDLQLEALTRADVVIDELPPGTRIVEARLGMGGGDDGRGDEGADQLRIDDAAWAIVPPDRLQRVLLVGPGNVYLQNALALLPNVEVYGATPTEYPTTTGKESFDLFVFDGWLPPELPDKPILAIGPPSTSPLGTVKGTFSEPAVAEAPADEPLLRNVDLSRLHVAQAQRIELPDWARPVLTGPANAPLIYAGSRMGLPTAVVAFDLRQSDLPLQVAWPILTANLAGELLGLAPSNLDSVRPGSPVELPLVRDATGVRVTLPDGTTREILPSATGASSVTFVMTTQLGPYRADPILPRSPAGSAPTPSGPAPPTPSGSPFRGQSNSDPSPGTSPATTGDASDPSIRFAVNLFDPNESNIAPGDGSRLAAWGTDQPNTAAANGRARDEWWVPIVLLVLLLLVLEWLVYERDGARRLLEATRAGVTSLMPRRRRRA